MRKRLWTTLLILTILVSLIPTVALAAEIPAEYKLKIKWTDELFPPSKNRSLTVNVSHEGEDVGTEYSEKQSYSATVKLESDDIEVYDHEASGGTYDRLLTKLFTFGIGKKEGNLKLYTRSKAGHKVTVKYEFADDSSKDSKSKNVKYAEEESFGSLYEKDYGYEIKVSSGDVKYKVTGDVLQVTGGAKDSEITVTYTPKNVIYIDQYYDNGGSLVKWNKTYITLNGPELLKGAAEADVIKKGDLTDAMEAYRFLTVGNDTYDFSFASLVPRKDDTLKIKYLWYEDEATLGYHWYYSHADDKKPYFPFGTTEMTKGSVNFCYNTLHTENSEHHDFVAMTVDPTCTERGYTDYKCKYCDKTEQRDFINPLNHDWGDYEHDNNTREKDSQHYQVCKREGCNATSTPEDCKFDLATTETGTHICELCPYSYTDEVTPTETPVYVYFYTVDSNGNPITNVEGITYNADTKDHSRRWATLGKLTTEQTVVASTDKTVVGKLGAEVNKTNSKFVKHQDNENFNLDLINEWVSLEQDSDVTDDFPNAGSSEWRLNGKVCAYKLTYDPNLPAGVAEEAVRGIPNPVYYLPGNAPVSTTAPTLQGYDFEGWYTDSGCKAKAGEKVDVSKDTVLYAKWTANSPTEPDIKAEDGALSFQHKIEGFNTWDASDTEAHKAKIQDPTINYQVELDLSQLKLSDGGKDKTHADTENFLEEVRNYLALEENQYKALRGNLIFNLVFDEKEVKPLTTQEAHNLRDSINEDGFHATSVELTSPESGKWGLKIELNIRMTKYSLADKITISNLPLHLTEALTDQDTDQIPRTITAKVSLTGEEIRTEEGPSLASAAVSVQAEPEVVPVNFDQPLTLSDMTAANTAKLYWKETGKDDKDDDKDPKFTLTLTKVDAETGSPLPGAKFELYQVGKKSDTLIGQSRYQTTDKNGKLSVSVSDSGEYYWVEIQPPQGYTIDKSEHYTDTGRNSSITVTNQKTGTPSQLTDDHFAYVIGYQDGTVRPYGLISRAETTTIFFRLLKDEVRDSNLRTSNTFKDVSDDYWANTAISTMTGLGIVTGRSADAFDPRAPITRAQFAAICARFDTGVRTGSTKFTDTEGHWAQAYIERAADLGWVQGFEDGSFRPDTYITRAQAMTMINRVLSRLPYDADDLSDGMNEWPDCTPSDWFYLAVQEATNSHNYTYTKHSNAGVYETWTKLKADPDWTRYEH